MFDLGPVAVYSCDTAGLIDNFNRRAAELWGRQPALGVDTEQRFCGSFKLFHRDGRSMPHDRTPMADVVSGRIAEVRDAEVLIERPDGSRITVIVNIRRQVGRVSLRELLVQEFEPYRSEEETRFVIEGPDFGLLPKPALALGMAFHELATNAAKYGALSNATGQVRVIWDLPGTPVPRPSTEMGGIGRAAGAEERSVQGSAQS